MTVHTYYTDLSVYLQSDNRVCYKSSVFELF